MSPSGIAMFYGAEDEETAIAEMLAVAPSRDDLLTIATFESRVPLHIVDLDAIPQVPSLFEPTALERRSSLVFLNRFASEVSRPVDRDEREHLEYVPTQIVTEYFRHVFEAEHGVRIDGIRYRVGSTGWRRMPRSLRRQRRVWRHQ
jgi:hypothetical protein